MVTPPAVVPAAKVAPPAAAIQRLAVTDEGDAAVTSDELGLRLWPRLDGTQEPRVVAGAQARALAIAHDGAELLVAILDQAGGLELVRLAGDGTPRGRAVVSAEPGFDQIAPLGAGVLARGRDQILRWYDAHGLLRGELAAEPHERIAAIATRRGGAIATFDEDAATGVRAIELSPALHWGPRIAVGPLRAVALSPSHTRIAGIRRGDGIVLELLPEVHQVGAASLVASREERMWTGFVDDTHAIFATLERTAWWGAKFDQEGSAAKGSPTELAIADRAIAGNGGAALVLVEPARWRYLGYASLGHGEARAFGAHVAITLGASLVWLDANLHLLHAMHVHGAADAPALALDDQHYLAVGSPREDMHEVPRTDLDIGTVGVESVRPLRSLPSLGGIEYDLGTRTLVIGTEETMLRFAIDDRGEARALGDLDVASGGSVVPLDPRVAHGQIAAGIEEKARRIQVIAFHEGAKSSIAAAGQLLGVARDGTVFMFHDTPRIDVYRDGARIGTIWLGETMPTRGAVARDGKTIALTEGDVIRAIDMWGHERWRRTLWEATGVVFVADDRELLVTTSGGYVALDAATGEPIATGCAWDFGIHDESPIATYNAVTVCE